MYERRALLKFLAASPLLAAFPALAEALQQGGLEQAAHALDVFDFEAAAQRMVPPAHWGYLMSGVDGEATLRANREGFNRYQLKARRFIDVSKIDMSVELFGVRYNSPVVLAPIGSSRAFHADGELGTARAALAKNQLMIMSTQASFGVEDIAKARNGPFWYQLYTTNNFDVTTKLVKRAEAAGCTAVAVTIDTPAGRNTATATRLARTDERDCKMCHGDATGNRITPRAGGGGAVKPMFAGLEMKGVGLTSATAIILRPVAVESRPSASVVSQIVEIDRQQSGAFAEMTWALIEPIDLANLVGDDVIPAVRLGPGAHRLRTVHHRSLM